MSREVNSTGKVQLTSTGEDALKAINAEEELLKAEKEVLKAVAAWATEEQIVRLNNN